jgi:hypothetical protein
MKIITSLLLFMFILIAIGYGSDNMRMKIAVLDIQSRINEEGFDPITISEFLQTELLRQGVFTIVERAYLSKVIEEQKLQFSGITDNDLTKIGKLVQADKIVTGSISKIDNSYILVVKMIDTTTGVIDNIEQGTSDTLKGILKTIPGIAVRLSQSYRNKVVSGETSQPTAEKVYDKSQISEREAEEVKPGVQKKYFPEPRKYFPVQIAFTKNIQLISKDFIITGLAIDLITGYNYGVYGIQAGFLNYTTEIIGLQCGFIERSDNKMYGLQAGFYNKSVGLAIGSQVGFINIADEMKGAQIGFYNYAKKITGVQIGFINFNKRGYVPFMFGINIGF